MMKHWISLALGGACTIALSFVALTRASNVSRPSAPTEVAPTVAVDTPPALERAPAPKPPSIQSLVATAPHVSSERNPPTDASPTQGPEAAHVRYHLHREFSRETYDAGWARDAQRTARSRMATVLPNGSSIRDVECRATMCRIETAHESFEQYEQFFEQAFVQPQSQVWNGAVFSTLADGPPARGERAIIVTYLAREGSELPLLE